ncbi:MAG: glycosyltransferase family 2 protein [bacterium]
MTYIPTVSILIPAHNEEAYIAACLDSLCALNYPGLEIVVCNNNSTDATCAIVEKYPNVILVHETIVGPNAARQKALRVSHGEIVATLDADCVVPKDWITSALPHFTNQHVVGITGVCRFDGKKSLRIALIIATDYLMRFFHWLFHRVLHARAIMPAANAWFRRSALESIGGFNTDIAFYGDDAHTALLLGKKGIIAYDPGVIVETSSRRFAQGGIVITAYRYMINYVSMWTVMRHVTSIKKTTHYR